MPASYRGKHEILYEIIRGLSVESKTRTRIMYDCHLSWTQLNDYLKFLESKGLIQVLKSLDYKATDKGFQYIKHFQEIQTLLA